MVCNNLAPDLPIFDDQAMEFGQLCRSSAVLGAGDDLPPAQRPEQWAGQPGTRAPHLWVSRGNERLSTFDLFQDNWVLLAEDERWHAAAKQASKQLGIPLECPRIGTDVVPSDLEAYRAARTGRRLAHSPRRLHGLALKRHRRRPAH